MAELLNSWWQLGNMDWRIRDIHVCLFGCPGITIFFFSISSLGPDRPGNVLCAGKSTAIVFYYFVFKSSRNDCFGRPLCNFRCPTRSTEAQQAQRRNMTPERTREFGRKRRIIDGQTALPVLQNLTLDKE
jgi:hypothetical protein